MAFCFIASCFIDPRFMASCDVVLPELAAIAPGKRLAGGKGKGKARVHRSFPGEKARRDEAVMPLLAPFAANRGRIARPDQLPCPATIFTVIAMMNTLKKNAITLCSSTTRRR